MPTTPPGLVELLQALVSIPSPNPPGDTRQIADFVADQLRNLTFDVRLLAPPEKPEAVSVVARFGNGDAPVIMLHAHIDTVPIAADEADRWSVDPYGAEVRDGKLYGKGSVDDKAPLAAMMIAAQEIAAAPFAGTLVIVAAAEEEVGGQLGTRWLAENDHLPPCDFIVVGEQTHNRVATAHKGVLRATVQAIGRSVHATNPNRGVNAIVAMAKAVLALEQYHRTLSQRVHPLVGVPTCNVGVIKGGSTANAVPDACTVLLDRRMIPGEAPDVVKAELEAVIAGVDATPAHLSVGDFLVSNWFSSTCESALGRAFLEAVREVLDADPGPIGYLPGSDAKHLVSRLRKDGNDGAVVGEIVVFGPGSYEVAHAFDEYVDLAELGATTDILITFLRRVLALKESP
jgi:acetylornithine deacetylase/succinyl-diaminopimelate desuccinylase family protein